MQMANIVTGRNSAAVVQYEVRQQRHPMSGHSQSRPMVRNHSDELRLIDSDSDVIEEANASSSHQSIESVPPCSIHWQQNTEKD